jgi:hypothetical protein
VLKNKRGLSRLEFYHTARKLREDITKMLLRDFGVRDKIRKIRTPENMEVTVIEGYPDWLITSFRLNMANLLRNLMMNIAAGNTIYPASLEELRQRRNYQTAAIINCEQLLREMQYCADVLPVKLEKFLPYAEAVEFENRLLKGWRKAGNKLNEKLKGG